MPWSAAPPPCTAARARTRRRARGWAAARGACPRKGPRKKSCASERPSVTMAFDACVELRPRSGTSIRMLQFAAGGSRVALAGPRPRVCRGARRGAPRPAPAPARRACAARARRRRVGTSASLRRSSATSPGNRGGGGRWRTRSRRGRSRRHAAGGGRGGGRGGRGSGRSPCCGPGPRARNARGVSTLTTRAPARRSPRRGPFWARRTGGSSRRSRSEYALTHAVEALDERDSLGARSSTSSLQSDEISAASPL